MSKTKRLTREELEAWAIRHGYKKDRWGHFQKTVANEKDVRVYRLKISQSSMRKEVNAGAGLGWTLLRSGYIRDLEIMADDKMKGLSVSGCKPNPRAVS